MSSSDEKSPIFSQAISEAFEPYLSVWIEAQDKSVGLRRKCVPIALTRERNLSAMIPKYRQQPPRPPDEEFSSQMVIPSSTELFSFYRLTLAQCAKLSPGARLVELTKVFAKYLDQYAQQVLLYYMSERPSGQTPSKLLSIEEIVLVLNTSDYCFNTCNQLEGKIKSRIDETYKDSIDLQIQADSFMGIASAAIRAFLRKVEVDIEGTWREMRNVGWSKMESVGDQSPYVEEMLRRIKSKAAEILALLHKQQYARAFCDNLVELVANSYLSNIFQCKPISEVGAEQVRVDLDPRFRGWQSVANIVKMLLDTYGLKKGFSELLTLNSAPSTPAPPSYLKRVSQSMSRVDPILKTLQVRPSPPEALVQAYLIHIADKSDVNFRKILDLKGLRKPDQTHLIDLFQAHRASPRNEALPRSSPLLTPMTVPSGGVSGTGVHLAAGLGSQLSSAASVSTANLQARFDPATFGSAIMSAARDGVDRFGSPVIGASSSGNTSSGAVTPAPLTQAVTAVTTTTTTTTSTEGVGGTGGNLNENLRNIGKFFKRDMGGFGGRFGSTTKNGDESG